MKVVILAGGFGTRLSEETAVRAKPMIEIGGQPILWHIMKVYAAHGFKEFVVALGYKGETVKDYFVNYRYRSRSLTVDMTTGSVHVHPGEGEEWVVHLLDTGASTQTGGRIKRAAQFIGREPFMVTYGDGVADIDVSRLVAFHRAQKRLATVTAVRAPARFGGMLLDDAAVARFQEKPQVGEGWINGGFFVLEPGAVDAISGDEAIWEREPVEHLCATGQLAAYRHTGFWQCMDTLRDVRTLEAHWDSGKAPWRIW